VYSVFGEQFSKLRLSQLRIIAGFPGGGYTLASMPWRGCPEGYARSSFYTIQKNNREAIAGVQANIDANNREQVGLILISNTEMLSKVIEAGLGVEEIKKIFIFYGMAI
jgi:hypothetical protein